MAASAGLSTSPNTLNILFALRSSTVPTDSIHLAKKRSVSQTKEKEDNCQEEDCPKD
jgi:hypothetical protein